MAFYITFFCQSGGMHAGDVLDALLGALRMRDETLGVSGRKDGDEWVSCELISVRSRPAEAGEAIVLEIHTGKVAVQSEVKGYGTGDEINAQRISGTDLVITLTV